jgi:hypothetical protein
MMDYVQFGCAKCVRLVQGLSSFSRELGVLNARNTPFLEQWTTFVKFALPSFLLLTPHS